MATRNRPSTENKRGHAARMMSEIQAARIARGQLESKPEDYRPATPRSGMLKVDDIEEERRLKREMDWSPI